MSTSPYLMLACAALGLLAVTASSQTVAVTKLSPAPTIDTNGDGKPDAWDRNGDGKADAWDLDGDGRPDALDDDGDGKPDQAQPPSNPAKSNDLQEGRN